MACKFTTAHLIQGKKTRHRDSCDKCGRIGPIPVGSAGRTRPERVGSGANDVTGVPGSGLGSEKSGFWMSHEFFALALSRTCVSTIACFVLTRRLCHCGGLACTIFFDGVECNYCYLGWILHVLVVCKQWNNLFRSDFVQLICKHNLKRHFRPVQLTILHVNWEVNTFQIGDLINPVLTDLKLQH